MRQTSRILTIASGVAIAVAGLAFPAGARSAAPQDGSVSLVSSSKTVTSSSGKKLKLEVEADQFTSSGSTTTSVTVTVGTGLVAGEASVGESHRWHFNLSNSSFSYANGTGTLKTGKQIAPFGTMSLTFKKSSQTSSCHGAQTTVKGTLSGSLHFSTGTTQWGKVGGNSISFATPDYLYMYASNGGSCGGGNYTAPCAQGLSWFGPGPSGAGESYFNGNNLGGTSRISFSRNLLLKSPANASRSDSISLPEPAPKFANNKLTITTNGGGFRGAATMSGGTTSTQNSGTCKSSGHTYTIHNKIWSNATWKTTTAHRFVVNFAITPDYTTPLSKTGQFFEQETYS